MLLRCLGFILVLSYPGQLHAQSPAESCAAPLLDGGFLVPELRTYSHGSTLAYACSAGQKPAVEGWWATSVCLNGLWSHTPQCIGENTCFAPDIPNAKYDESPDGMWYKEESVIWIKCDEGYKHKGVGATATCKKGVWSDLPGCERSDTSCNEPPHIPHAVILDKYQDVYAADVEVRYECEDGYGVEVATTKKSVFCVAGSWTQAASCTMLKPGPGDDGDTSGGSTKPVDGNVGSGRRGGATGPGTGDSTDTATTGVGTDGSSATGTRPGTTSDRPGSPSSPLFTEVVNCGSYPKVPNGDVVRKTKMSLRYACNAFYKRVGQETVVCYADGTWSQPPTCKEAFCQINLDEYTGYRFQESGTVILKERETKSVQCIWSDYTGRISCVQGRIRVTQCCHNVDHDHRRCN